MKSKLKSKKIKKSFKNTDKVFFKSKIKNSIKKSNYSKIFNKIKDVTYQDENYKKKLSCWYKEYENLLQDKYNYKNYYKNYESNQQIKTIVNLSLKYDTTIFSRLIDLILKRFNPIFLTKIIKLLLSKQNDYQTYKELRKLYKNKNNKIKLITPISCNKNKILAQTIIWKLKYIKNVEITKYLDIGTGNGAFAIIFGNELNLDRKNIYGSDFEYFSERGDWNRTTFTDYFNFVPIIKNEKYPFEDDTFNIITMKMVLHHVDNLDFTLKEIKRILKNNGLLIIIEHSAFTYVDYMLNDIEHGLYINVYNSNSLEEYSYNNDNRIKDVDTFRYYDFNEIGNIMRTYKFNYTVGDIFSESVSKKETSTFAHIMIYQNSK